MYVKSIMRDNIVILLTTEAIDSISHIHNRMPLMLTKEMGLAYLRDDKFDLDTYKKHSQSY